MKGGLSSGEGLINEVRDAVQKWDTKAQQLETVDPGVADKRLMVTEAELTTKGYPRVHGPPTGALPDRSSSVGHRKGECIGHRLLLYPTLPI
jgi:hypothetical protein